MPGPKVSEQNIALNNEKIAVFFFSPVNDFYEGELEIGRFIGFV